MSTASTWWADILASLDPNPWIDLATYTSVRVVRTRPYSQVIVATRRRGPPGHFYVIKLDLLAYSWENEVVALSRLRDRAARKCFPRLLRSQEFAQTTDYCPTCYTIVEYFPGQQLSAVIDQIQKQWGLVQRVHLVIQLAEAVQTLHDAGVIHRDLNFGNFMVDMTSSPLTVCIVDFGLAVLVEDAGRLSQNPLRPPGEG